MQIAMRMTIVLLIAAAATLTSCIGSRSFKAPLVLSVRAKPDGCRVIFERKEVTSDELLALARSSAGARRAVVINDVDTPYRCIGGARAD